MDLCKMHFCKHMDGFYMHSISLPEKVKIHFATLVGKLLELKRPSGKIWYVGLIKTGEKLVLQPGWHEFVSANDVSQSDLIVFRYNSETTFEVLIFDQSGSERSCTTEEESDGSMQIVINESRPVNFTAPLPDFDLHTNEDDKYRGSGEKGESEIPFLASSENSGENKNVCDASTAMVTGRMTGEQRRKAQKLQQQAQAGSPSFAVVIEQYHVSRFGLTIPSKFSSGHLPKKHEEFVLRLAGDKGIWPAKYKYRSYRQDMYFKKFSCDNNLQRGDICLFELVKGVKYTAFNVYISRKI